MRQGIIREGDGGDRRLEKEIDRLREDREEGAWAIGEYRA